MMKNMDRLLKWALWIALFLFVLTTLDFLALHDIYKDYVSPMVFDNLNLNLPLGLPAWTNTEMEWNAVTINFLFRNSVTLVNLLLILVIRRVFQKSVRKDLHSS